MNDFVDSLLRRRTDGSEQDLSLVAFYPADRVVKDVPLQIHDSEALDPLDAFDSFRRGTENFHSLFRWLREREDLENEKRRVKDFSDPCENLSGEQRERQNGDKEHRREQKKEKPREVAERQRLLESDRERNRRASGDREERSDREVQRDREEFSERLADFVASDGHSPYMRTPYLADAEEFISEEFSPDYAKLLLEYNPGAVVEDRHITGF